MLRHVLLSAVYESGTAIESREFTQTFKDLVEVNGAEAIGCVSYTTTFSGTLASPVQLGLKDVWMHMTDGERRALPKPLQMAIGALIMPLEDVRNGHAETH